MPKDLGGYLGTLEGEYTATNTKTEWTWKGATPSSARKVGDVWVVLEHPEGGVIATILTDKWE